MQKKNLIIIGGAIVLVIGGTLLFTMKKFPIGQPIINEWIPNITFLPTATIDSTVKPTPLTKPTTVFKTDPILFTGAATCKIGGQIKFVSPTISQNSRAQLVYTGIDNPARLIKWQVTPSADLKVGPNLAAGIKRPDGTENIELTLPEAVTIKHYVLRASMTYGRIVNNDIKLFEASCSGETVVEVAF